MMTDNLEDNHWKIDRRVPVIWILATLGQILFFAYMGLIWMSETDGRLNSLEKYQVDTTGQESRIIVLEQQFGYIREDLAEIKVLIRENGSAIRKDQP